MSRKTNSVIVARLRSAEGHLRAITYMVESGEDCKDVLHQLNAVQGALSAVIRILLEDHLKANEAIIKNSTCAEERAQALDYLIMLYHLTYERQGN